MDNQDEQNDGDGEAAVSVHLGTSFTVETAKVLNGQLPYNTQALIEAMRENASVTDLTVDFGFRLNQMPAFDLWEHEGGQGLVPFLVQYITSRNHLHKLSFGRMGWLLETFLDGYRQILMAARSGSGMIQHFCLKRMKGISAQILAAFCRVNSKVKTLEVRSTFFKTKPSSLQGALQRDMLHLASITALDKLVLDRVGFSSDDEWKLITRALAPDLKIMTLQLGCLQYMRKIGRHNPLPLVSKLMRSKVKRLILLGKCKLTTFTAAFEAQDTVELRVKLRSQHQGREKFDVLVTIMLPNMPKLRVLYIFVSDNDMSSQGLIINEAKQRFVQLVDAGVTLTDVQVNVEGGGDVGVFSQEEMQWLQGRAIRNRNLIRFVENPSSLSEKELLMLMLRLDRCPTGRLQLARALPKAYFSVSK